MRTKIWLHAAALGWVLAMLALAYFLPDEYRRLLQEDYLVEWWTVALFVAAAALRLFAAVRQRRLFDALIGLFCVFVAGEEFSWGQRLLGFTPPEVFLEHNTQQELTLHNFADVFGQPKGILTLALLGYAVVLPLLALARPGRRLLDRLGATPPPGAAALWFMIAATLLLWYPFELTGEWVEALAGGLFLYTATGLGSVRFLRASLVTAATAVVLTMVSALTIRADPTALSCARAETNALVRDVVTGLYEGARLLEATVHKRMLSALQDGYLDTIDFETFWRVDCEGESLESATRRHSYLIDPWGMAYWLATAWDSAGAQTITVYSFGPNRRRDGPAGSSAGDDVFTSGAPPR